MNVRQRLLRQTARLDANDPDVRRAEQWLSGRRRYGQTLTPTEYFYEGCEIADRLEAKPDAR